MDGSRDIAHGMSHLRVVLPEALLPLADIAYNYRWAWSPEGPDLFRRIGGSAWERSGENPVLFLREAQDSLERAAQDTGVVATATRLAGAIAQARAVHDGALLHDALGHEGRRRIPERITHLRTSGPDGRRGHQGLPRGI